MSPMGGHWCQGLDVRGDILWGGTTIQIMMLNCHALEKLIVLNNDIIHMYFIIARVCLQHCVRILLADYKFFLL